MNRFLPLLFGMVTFVSHAQDTLLVEEFTMTFNSYFEYETQVLESGESYFMTIDGQYNISSGTYGHKDAAWYFCYASCSGGCNSTTPCPSLDEDNWNARITSLRPDVDIYDPNHHYEYSITGEGASMTFDFNDVAYGDNGGALVIAIHAIIDQIEGCTDPSACNFEEDASEDDGSCQYLEVNAEEFCTADVGALVEIDLTPFEGMIFAEDVIEIEGGQFLGEFEGTNYFLTTSDLTPQDWDALEAQIAPFSGHLVDIHSEAENDFIVNSVFSVFGGSAAWIGFTDVDSEGTWVWRSGAPVTYTAWNTGEPNNSGNEHWAIMHDANHPLPGSWNDLPITSQFPAIFEIPSNALQFVWSNGEIGLSTQFYSADGSEEVTLFDDGIELCSSTFELATSTECNDEMACNYHAQDHCNSGCIYPLVPGDCALGAGACTQGMEWDIETQTCVITNPADINLDGCVQLGDLLDLLSAYGDCGVDESPWQCGDPLEYQGYVYETVQIGEQCWFAENLRAENYRNGDQILSALSLAGSGSTDVGATAVYGGGDLACTHSSPDFNACNPTLALEEYALLYNGHAVVDPRGLCPAGWGVPSDSTWMVMEMSLGMTQEEAGDTGDRGVNEGQKLKSSDGWFEANNGNNLSGFNGKPSGRYMPSYVQSPFRLAGENCYWWSSSYSDTTELWARRLNYDNDQVGRYVAGYVLEEGLSVRCIKDSE